MIKHIHYSYGCFKTLAVLLSIFLVNYAEVIAQDPIFTQYYNAPLLMNPGFAGLNSEAKIYLNYRNQWSGLPNGYRTYAVSYDKYFDELNSGFGALLLSDDAGNGILKTNKLAGIYSYKIYLNKNHFIKAGFEFGVVQARLNFDKLIFSDQIDPEFGPITQGGSILPSSEEIPEQNSNIYADIGLGLVYYNKYFYAGVSLKHINTPSQSYLKINENLQEGLPMRISAQFGGEIAVGSMFSGRLPVFIAPSAAYFEQGPFRQANIGSFVHFGAIGLGGWYRTNFSTSDAIIGAVMLNIGKITVGYSFDYSVSELDLNGGTHEIGIGINFDNGINESIYNDCFKIFR